ncbi:MAG: GNAT family N-acetyltransferase [Methanosphaera stadtmanae]|nr:GNAT family N-acetyltransferase [Methanosphaera stadtmanae]
MIKLVKPSYELKNEIIDFKKEFIKNDENTIPGSELLDKIDTFDEWLNYVCKNNSPDTVSKDWVVTDTLLAINHNMLVGIISLRHELNDFLKDFGHIGYSVRPSCRCNGFATAMLKEVLEIAKNYGLNELQLSSEKDNIASIRIIEKNQGKYTRSFNYLDKEVYVYKIRLY